jgi:hypothetical protein
MLVVVEWTKARVVAAGMTQLDPGFGDKVYDIDPGFDLIDD